MGLIPILYWLYVSIPIPDREAFSNLSSSRFYEHLWPQERKGSLYLIKQNPEKIPDPQKDWEFWPPSLLALFPTNSFL